MTAWDDATAVHRRPRRRPRGRVLVAALLAALLVVAAGVTVAVVATRTAAVSIDASSTSAGDADDLLGDAGSARAARWQSTTTVGSSLTMRFSHPVQVDGQQLVGAAGALRIAEARLAFSDGSALVLHTDARGDARLAFPARRVTWMRLEVAAVPGGQTAIGLRRWVADRGGATTVLTGASALRDVRSQASSGAVTTSGWTAAQPGSGQWIERDWRTPAVVSAVRLLGVASSTDAVTAGSLVFQDGSSVLVGGLNAPGGAPTTVAFTPRVTTSVRFVATGVRGTAAVSAFDVVPVGVLPPAVTAAASTPAQAPASAQSCAGVHAASPSAALTLLCPSNGSAVGSSLDLVVAAPASAVLTVRGWRSGGAVVLGTAKADATGTAALSVPTIALQHGPAAVRIDAVGVAVPLYVQFVNGAGTPTAGATPAFTRGMDLKLDERFTAPLSASRTGVGAAYATGKPNSFGMNDFGAAIFAAPDGTADTMSTMPGGILRIPAHPLAAGQTDPSGYKRGAVGGLLSSGSLGASGFAAQYGYFQVRMLAPAGDGTWPAFWMLSTGSLVQKDTTAEVDAIELYGHDTGLAVQTSHSYTAHGDTLGTSNKSRMPDSGDWALSWHTYGAAISPTGVDYYVDGVRTAHTVAVIDASEPFFTLVDLALQDSWPTGLAGTGGRVALYVDRVQVWV